MKGSYLNLHASGELASRAEEAVARLCECAMCPRECRVDRPGGELGSCNTGRLAQIASWNLHFGEEAPLVGESGSGTIFFAHCNLGCAFCQNWDISLSTDGFEEALPEQLALLMLQLQEQGAANINFVTPSHVAAQILEALPIAADRGLTLPLVYNSSGYDSLDTLRLLDGVVDIYMPDTKFWSSGPARKYCNAPDYPDRARAALKEMHRQVGDLILDDRGLAERGMLVRHLVMPEDLAETASWMEFLAQELSPQTYVNVMDQYRPCGDAEKHPEIATAPSRAQCEHARAAAREAGLTRLDDRSERQAWVLMDKLRGMMGDDPGGQ
jgi:putative pyruvate formate lyase activating enzyme